MKTIKIILYSITVVLLLSSCEKVIDVDLNDAAPQNVFEANLINGLNDLEVNLTKTGSYFDSEPLETINDASVVLETENGDRLPLDFIGEGLYKVKDYQAESGQNYRLEVELEGQTYMADSYMWDKVEIDDLRVEFREAGPINDEGYFLSVAFQDPLERENYYRLLITLNGELLNSGEDLYLFDDKLANGNEIEYPIFNRRFEEGDSVKVELRSLDAASFLYFETLSEIVGGNGPSSAAPGNPTTNWSGEVQGHFSAYSTDFKGITIQP